jgi:hypothetical protein
MLFKICTYKLSMFHNIPVKFRDYPSYLQVLELISRKQSMAVVMLPVVTGCESAERFVERTLHGFERDAEYTVEASYQMWTKAATWTSTLAPRSPEPAVTQGRRWRSLKAPMQIDYNNNELAYAGQLNSSTYLRALFGTP